MKAAKLSERRISQPLDNSTEAPSRAGSRKPGRRASRDRADARNWKLPSGQQLAEFAWQCGFLAHGLLEADKAAKSSDAQGVRSPQRRPVRIAALEEHG
jgi:hypothetical protein